MTPQPTADHVPKLASGKSREEIALAYKSEPWWYDVRGFFILTFAYNSTLPQQLRFFGPHFGPKHLELACGSGTLLAWFLRWRRRQRLPMVDIVGIDYAESMLAGAIRRFAGNPRLQFEHADAAALPFADGGFDTVNCANAVHCLPAVDAAWREMHRVLKPGGTVAANVLLHPRGDGMLARIARAINRWGIRKGILVTPYTADEVRAQVARAGLVIEHDSITGNCLNLRARRPA